MLLCDFHIHSRYSDGKHRIPEIVDFYGKRGFDCIAITDHFCETKTLLGIGAQYLERTLTPESLPDYLSEIQNEAERALHQWGMLVIPGFEITKNYLSNQRSAHFIGVGVNRGINPNASIDSILLDLKQQGALTIAAHPLSNRTFEKQTLHLWDRREDLAHLFDAWEVGSGHHYFPEVANSGLPMIANTDLHRFEQIGGWKTRVHADLDQEAIFDAIRRQKIRFEYGDRIDLSLDPHSKNRENLDYAKGIGP
jgi:hypothetical protein